MKDKNTLFLGLLLAGFAFSLYFLSIVGISLTGLVVATTTTTQDQINLNLITNQTTTTQLDLQNITKLAITANITGNGTIIITSNQLNIYQETLENETITLNNYCNETCNITKTNITQLEIEIQGNITINLQTINYEKTITTITPTTQIFNTNITNFTIKQNETLTINLQDHFETTNVFFDALSSDGYTYQINQTTITYNSLFIGTFRAKIYGVYQDIVHESNDFFITIISNETIAEEPINETTTQENLSNETTIEIPIKEIIAEEPTNETVTEDSTNETVLEETEKVEETTIEEPTTQPEQTQTTIPQVQTQGQTTRTYTIQSNTLQGVLEPGTTITIIENYYSTNTPQRNDVIAFNHAREGTVIKIIKGISGDSFRVENNRIILNNQTLTNNQGQEYVISDRAQILLRLYERDYKRQIPQGAYLILGNTPTQDTGSSRFGLVHISDFEGRVSS